MTTKQIARYGMLTAVMLVLGFVERQFILVPGIPGIRLGLSNTVLLYALCLMNGRAAWLLLGLKVLMGGLLYAGFSGMMYSAAGGLLSMLVMLLTLRIRGFGLAGVSVCGAVGHMAGQILMSRALLGSWAAAVNAPILLVCAVVTGVVTGVAGLTLCRAIARTDPQGMQRMQKLGLMEGKKP